jgi:hypothetical protein
LFENRTFNLPIVVKGQAVEKIPNALVLDTQSTDEFDDSDGITRKFLYSSALGNHQLQPGSVAASGWQLQRVS